VQTFLPYPDFWQSMRVLDRGRLGCQRKEARQIINILENKTKAWRHSPAVLMWRNYIDALKVYTNAAIAEWIRRGYNNEMPLYQIADPNAVIYPHWLGYTPLHHSHQDALVRKYFESASVPDKHYPSLFDDHNYTDYVWVSRKWTARDCYRSYTADPSWIERHRVFDGIRPVVTLRMTRNGICASGVVVANSHPLIVDLLI